MRVGFIHKEKMMDKIMRVALFVIIAGSIIYSFNYYRLKDKRSIEVNNKPNGENLYGLVELKKLDKSFVIDLRYATDNNFTHHKIYSEPKCILQESTARKLIEVNNELREMGYRLKIFDAYRPYSAQKILYDAASDKTYVANPNKEGSIHNRGAAVDVTLVDESGNELDMPSDYDEFTERAHINYNDCTKKQKENREFLAQVMVRHGFERLSSEWWHFNDKDAMKHPILDIPFEEFD